MAVSSTEDAALRAHLERGEVRAAAELLVRAHAGAVLDLCTAMLRDRTRAEDLTQDVFGKAFVALPRFRGDSSARTWLLRIARNHCIDHLRARRIEPWPDPDVAEETHDSAPLPHDLFDSRQDVQRALACLAEGERALVVLRFKNGLDYGELAQAFDLKEGTVRMRVSRALAKMRAQLTSPPAAAAPAAVLGAMAPPPRGRARKPPAAAPPVFESLGRARRQVPAAPAALPPAASAPFDAALPPPSSALLAALLRRAGAL